VSGITKEEFCQRFKARMIAINGETLADGRNVADYADDAVGRYWDTDWQRDQGPGACADADKEEREEEDE